MNEKKMIMGLRFYKESISSCLLEISFGMITKIE